VNCDTSNGYTPKIYTELNTIPLAYVTAKTVGISSLTEEGKLDSENTKGYSNTNDNNTTPFQQLIQDWEYTSTPTVNGNSIDYNTFKLVKDTSEKFKPLKIQDNTNLGGRKRCSKKMIKKCKRMTKKMRAKMGCRHCC
jgi:hypothetical protein